MTGPVDLTDRAVVCIAGGPSLTREDCAYAEQSGTIIIGVNDAYRIAKCNVLYGSDYHWWEHHWEAVKDLDLLRVSQTHNAEVCPVPVYLVPGQAGNDLTDQTLNFAGNSGFAALHLAILWGAARILLLGYDVQMGKKRHWFGDHPGRMNFRSDYSSMAKAFERSPKPTIPIINCSRATALRCFPRSTIQEQL